MKTKLLLLMIEPFLVAKVVLCWIVALPVLALFSSGLMVWDKANSAVAGILQRRRPGRFQLRRVNVGG
jgi:hypothetical protein